MSLEAASPYTFQVLKRLGVERRWEDGQILLSRGQIAESVLMVLSGRLRIALVSPNGEELLLRWFKAGEITGLTSMVSGAPFSADLIATGPTRVLHVEGRRLIDAIHTDGELAMAVIRILSLRVNHLMDLLLTNQGTSLQQRVWAALLRLASYHGVATPDGVRLELSQEEIAHAVGASRQRVNLELRRIERLGRIRLGYRSIVLLGHGRDAGD